MPNLLAAVSLIAAIAYGTEFVRAEPSMARTIFKAFPIAALAALVALMGGPALLVFALALSAIGDLALSRDGERAFMAGLGAFLVAHLAYIPLFWAGFDPSALRIVAMIAAVAYTGIVARWLWPHLGAMRVPVAAYVLVILGMGIAALTTTNPLLLIGAGLFILSDTVLAAETFVFASRPRRWTSPVVWVTYYAGQVLIAAAIMI